MGQHHPTRTILDDKSKSASRGREQPVTHGAMPPEVYNHIQEKYILVQSNVEAYSNRGLAIAIKRQDVQNLQITPNSPIEEDVIQNLCKSACVAIRYIHPRRDRVLAQSMLRNEANVMTRLVDKNVPNVVRLIEVDPERRKTAGNEPIDDQWAPEGAYEKWEIQSPCRFIVLETPRTGPTLQSLMFDSRNFPQGIPSSFACHIFLQLGQTLLKLRQSFPTHSFWLNSHLVESVFVHTVDHREYPNLIMQDFGGVVLGSKAYRHDEFSLYRMIGYFVEKNASWLHNRSLVESAEQYRKRRRDLFKKGDWKNFINAIRTDGGRVPDLLEVIFGKYESMARKCLEAADDIERSYIADSISDAIARKQKELNIDDESIEKAILEDMKSH